MAGGAEVALEEEGLVCDIIWEEREKIHHNIQRERKGAEKN